MFLIVDWLSDLSCSLSWPRIHGDRIAAGVKGTVWSPSQGSTVTVHVQYGKRHRWTSKGASPNITIYLYIIPKQASFNTGCIVALATVRRLFQVIFGDLVAVPFWGCGSPCGAPNRTGQPLWSRAVWALHHESPSADLLLLCANLGH